MRVKWSVWTEKWTCGKWQRKSPLGRSHVALNRLDRSSPVLVEYDPILEPWWTTNHTDITVIDSDPRAGEGAGCNTYRWPVPGCGHVLVARISLLDPGSKSRAGNSLHSRIRRTDGFCMAAGAGVSGRNAVMLAESLLFVDPVAPAWTPWLSYGPTCKLHSKQCTVW